MKKKIWMAIIILAAILSVYIYSLGRQELNLLKPEDMAGKQASAFLPSEVQGKPAAKGSSELKLTGPVWVEE